jgi:hypothetical protein
MGAALSERGAAGKGLPGIGKRLREIKALRLDVTETVGDTMPWPSS